MNPANKSIFNGVMVPAIMVYFNNALTVLAILSYCDSVPFYCDNTQRCINMQLKLFKYTISLINILNK